MIDANGGVADATMNKASCHGREAQPGRLRSRYVDPAFLNLKGGLAKTTKAVAVAECLADSGYRTLLIDADHQCMLVNFCSARSDY